MALLLNDFFVGVPLFPVSLSKAIESFNRELSLKYRTEEEMRDQLEKLRDSLRQELESDVRTLADQQVKVEKY